MVAIDALNYYVVGDNYVLRTTNGGSSWSVVADDGLRDIDLYTVASSGPGNVWIAGTDGRSSRWDGGSFLARSRAYVNNRATGTFTILEDTAGPSAVTVSSPPTVTSGTSIPVTFDTGWPVLGDVINKPAAATQPAQ